MILCISVVSVVTFLFLIYLFEFPFSLFSLTKGLLIFAYIFKVKFQLHQTYFLFQSLFKLLFSLSFYPSLLHDIFLTNSELCSLSFSLGVTLFTWNLFISFLSQACITNNFPLRTTFAVLRRIWYAIFLF